VSVSSIGSETRVDVRRQAATGSTPVTSNDQGVLRFEVDGTQVR
jgi:hypothetical protein